MYAHFYQLSENPFNLTPDPKFHYINESTREAMASLLHGIKSRKGFLTLIGEAGTGKTTLLQARSSTRSRARPRSCSSSTPACSFDELARVHLHGARHRHGRAPPASAAGRSTLTCSSS